VAVNTLNHLTNSSYFVTNATESNVEVVYDGLTVILAVTAPVTPNVANHIKLVIGDGGDDAYDSGVFLEAGSFSAAAVDMNKSVDDPTPIPGQLITYTLVVNSNSSVSATNALISDTLPTGLTFAGPVTLVPPQPGATLAEDTGDLPVLASGVTITAQESITVTFPVTVNAGLGDGTVVLNIAAVTSTQVVTPVTGMVAVTVQNIAPVAADDSPSTPEDTVVTILPLGNDTDANGDTLSVDAIGTPIYGTATISGTTQIVYTPTLNYNGEDSFAHTASDGILTDTATITVTVDPVDDPPIVGDVSDATDEDTVTTGTLVVTDPDAGDSHTYGMTTPPDHGSASVDSSGDWSYTPANRTASYDVSFTITVTDSTNLTNTTTVIVSVTADNDVPSVEDATAATDADTPVSDILVVNDPDTDDSYSYGVVTLPDRGYAEIDASGVWTFTPAAHTKNYTVTFTLTVTDTGSNSDDATITITVSTNGPPVANADAATTIQDQPLALDVLDNDSDPDDDSLSVIAVGLAVNGSVISNGDSVTYTPGSGFLGTDSFTYTIFDGELTDTAAVTVAVVEGESADPIDPA
jgi:uncharacterized repeat protein (TIGR01451 family)